MHRRTFLGAAAGAALADLAAQAPPFPIIDTHIHLYDPSRPEGVPWPPKNTVMYRTVLPDGYRRIAGPLGVVGAIEVECSPWLEDNQWVLDVAARDTIIVGTVGDLEPGKPDFRKHLDRFHKNPLFRGIRFGYLWGRNLAAELPKEQFISDLKALAEAGLTLDSAGGASLPGELVRLTDRVPELRVVIDHLPAIDPPQERAARAAYDAALRELAKRPQVYVKVSEVLRRAGGRVPYELSFYRPKLDELWEIFGPDRLLYGSDWPNSDPLGTYSQVLHVVREYFAGKGREASEKYFWKNSVAAYRWVKREAAQPEPTWAGNPRA